MKCVKYQYTSLLKFLVPPIYLQKKKLLYPSYVVLNFNGVLFEILSIYKINFVILVIMGGCICSDYFLLFVSSI